MSCAEYNFTIKQGETFSKVLRWETEPLVFKAITGIIRAAPVVVTAVAHGLTSGWRAAVSGAGGMVQINADRLPPRTRDFHVATVLTPDTVAFQDVDSSDFEAWTSGGSLVYYTAHSLSGYTARMHIRETVDSDDTLLELTTTNSRIVLDDAAKTITLTITATDTAAIDWLTGVYDLELVSAGGVVTRLLEGTVTVSEEVTL